MTEQANLREHFSRTELAIAALILNDGAISTRYVVDQIDGTPSSVHQSIQRAVQRGILSEATVDEVHAERLRGSGGPKPRFYDLTPGALEVVQSELEVVQVFNLNQAIQRRRRLLGESS